jgi:pSer/pThr/pTyr-binding forkhead associated (FHA) protein
MPEIIVKFDNKIVERVVTEKSNISIGRTAENDVVLDNRGVSRKHARIEVTPENAILYDNESLNGTFLNSRKVSEEPLKDRDVITIGKFDLEFRNAEEVQERMSDHEGTMILNTKRHRQLMETDKRDKALTKKSGCSVLVGVNNTDEKEIALDRDVTTFGKSKFVNVRTKGWFISAIQAKIVKEGHSYTVFNVGRSGKTRINGSGIESHVLRNGDIVQIGKAAFRFVEAGA